MIELQYSAVVDDPDERGFVTMTFIKRFHPTEDQWDAINLYKSARSAAARFARGQSLVYLVCGDIRERRNIVGHIVALGVKQKRLDAWIPVVR